jgi:nitrous oxidase accessory protein
MAMAALRYLALMLLLVPVGQGGLAVPSLQALIDATPVGGTLQPAPGIYAGPVLIAKPMVLDGAGQVTLDGAGLATVLTIRGGAVTVRGMRITNSGNSHDRVDAAILVEGDANLIEYNVLADVLFGIFLRQANDNHIRGNRIRSRGGELAERGDAVRLWYSRRNVIEANDIAQVRDVTLANSPRNRLLGNDIRDGRYAMHFVFSPRNVVEDNRISRTTTGVIGINSEGLIVRRNRIQHVLDGGGAGIVFKSSSAGLAEGNDVVHCTAGVLADSPIHPTNRITLVGNRFAHNITGVAFYGEKGGHIVRNNRFENNLSQVALSPGGDPHGNDWLGNYWDDYQGFDRDDDGIGDTPYEINAFADRIWMELPMAKFFRNSPVFEALDFLERLAPFAAPELLLRDPAPQAHGRRR